MSYTTGQKVVFTPRKGKPVNAEVYAYSPGGKLWITIEGDPFPVTVKKSQVSACEPSGKPVKSKKKVRKDRTSTERRERNMATATDSKPSAKELRKLAQGLGIADYEDLSRKELAKAVAKAQKAQNGSGAKAKSKDKAKGSKSKSAAKATSKAKPAAEKSKPAKSGGKASGNEANPFRKGSNLFHIAELLIKGGNREKLATKLSEKVALHPYSQQGDTTIADYDKRIVLGAQTLRDKHGFTIERDGRGLAGTIKAVPPTGKKAKAKK